MESRTQAASRHRRIFAIGMGLSVAIHAAVFALLRFGVPAVPADEGSRAEAASESRYLAQRPIRVVRLAAERPAPQAASRQAGALSETSAARKPARADALRAPRPSLSAAALDLRPVEGTSGGLEAVALTSTASSAEGSGADLNEGVVFEAASRAARDAARDRGRDRRGARGSGIGIAIVGTGGGDCDPSLLPGGGVTLPPAVVDDFTGVSGGIVGGSRSAGGSAPGGLIGGILSGNGRNLGGGSVLGGGGSIRIGLGGGGRRF